MCASTCTKDWATGLTDRPTSPASPLRRFLQRLLADGNRTRKAYLNALTEALDYATRLLVGFVINPLLVAGLGSYAYGVWQILDRLIGQLNHASDRPFQALKWTLASLQSSTDFEQKRRQVGCAALTWAMVAPLFAAACCSLAWFAPELLQAPPALHAEVRIAAFMLAANLILISLVDLPRSILIGENLSYKRMGLSAMLSLLTGLLMALALYLDAGLIGLALAVLTVSTVSGVLFLRVAIRFVGWLGIARPRWSEVRQFAKLSGWFVVWALVMVTMRASDVAILGTLDSVEQVTSYTLTRYVPETLVNLISILVWGITPGLGGVIGAGEYEKAAGLRGEAMVLSWVLITVIGTATVLWNRAFLTLWVGADYYAGTLATLLIVSLITQFVMIRNDSYIIELTLDLRRKVLLGISATALSIGLAVLAVGYYDLGIVGLCAGLIAGRSVLSLAYPWLIGQTLGVTLAAQLRQACRPALVLALMLGLAAWLEAALMPAGALGVDSWPALIAAVACTVALIVPLAIFLGLRSDQRARIFDRLRTVLNRPAGGSQRTS